MVRFQTQEPCDGVAFARGLSLALSIPCIGVTSLEAALPDGQQGSSVVLLPAQRRAPDITYWCQRFRSGAAIAEAEEVTLEAIVADLRAHPHFVYGEGLDALTDALPDLVTHPATTRADRAAILAQGFDPESHLPSPAYVRAPDVALPGGKQPPPQT